MANAKLKPIESKVDYFEVKLFRQYIDQNDQMTGMTVFGGAMKIGLKSRKFGEDFEVGKEIQSERYWYSFDGQKFESKIDKEDSNCTAVTISAAQIRTQICTHNECKNTFRLSVKSPLNELCYFAMQIIYL